MRNGCFGFNCQVKRSVGDSLAVFVETVGVAVRAGVGRFVDYGSAHGAEFVRGGVVGDGGGHFFEVGLHGGHCSEFWVGVQGFVGS